MSRILVVARERTLQQALVLSLCQDHDIRSWPGWEAGDSPALSDFELVIVEGTLRRNVKTFAAQLLRAIEDTKIPTIWIQEAEGHEASQRKHAVTLKLPLQKETLKSAVATALKSRPSTPNAKRSVAVKEKTGLLRTSAKPARHDRNKPPGTSEIIELVDVVEESAADHEENHLHGKTN